jgi:hypothetical protein
VIAQRDDVLLRHATEADLPAIDGLTTVAYAPIQESFVAMLGSDLYEAVQADPGKTWDERKAAQNRRLFAEHPEQVWVLEDTGGVFGYVTFWLFPERGYGHLDNSAVDPSCRGEGWARFMYIHARPFPLARPPLRPRRHRPRRRAYRRTRRLRGGRLRPQRPDGRPLATTLTSRELDMRPLTQTTGPQL